MRWLNILCRIWPIFDWSRPWGHIALSLSPGYWQLGVQIMRLTDDHGHDVWTVDINLPFAWLEVWYFEGRIA